jgi:hypothetical protein
MVTLPAVCRYFPLIKYVLIDLCLQPLTIIHEIIVPLSGSSHLNPALDFDFEGNDRGWLHHLFGSDESDWSFWYFVVLGNGKRAWTCFLSDSLYHLHIFNWCILTLTQSIVWVFYACCILACLPLFNVVQKFSSDILGNVVTISGNQALESIHPADKDRFDHFGWGTCQNFIHDFI